LGQVAFQKRDIDAVSDYARCVEIPVAILPLVLVGLSDAVTDTLLEEVSTKGTMRGLIGQLHRGCPCVDEGTTTLEKPISEPGHGGEGVRDLLLCGFLVRVDRSRETVHDARGIYRLSRALRLTR
jgi:hypothetical protein